MKIIESFLSQYVGIRDLGFILKVWLALNSKGLILI